MLYRFYLLIFFLLFTSCTQHSDENTMILTGQIHGLKKGTIFLERIIDTSYVAIDSFKIYGDSKFHFQQQIESPEVLHLYLRLDNGNLLDDRVSFFAEPKEIDFSTNLEDFSNPYITGSENHAKMLTYYKMAKRYQDRNLDLFVEEFNAKKDNNDSLMKIIEQKKQTLLRTSYLATVNFALQNSEFEIAPFIMVYETPDIHKSYLDTVYNSLSDKVKQGIYGKRLKEIIANKE